jgi:hypothetical protein
MPWIACAFAMVASMASIACSKSSNDSTHATTTTANESAPPAPTTSCTLPDPNGYAPSAWVAPHAPQHACTDDEIALYVTDCIDPATSIPIECEQFGANHPTCAACILPKDPTQGSGVFLPRPGEDDLNVGGCIAILLDDPSPQGCGAREQAARDCVDYECRGCDDPKCVAVAQQTACAAFEMNVCRELAVAATCALDHGLADDALRVGRVMCGM